MFKIILIAISMLSLTSMAGELDGKSFCRTIGGGLGAPKGYKIEHCVQFKDNKMKDSRIKPSQTPNYVLVGDKILTIMEGQLISDYSMNSKKDVLIYDNEAELTLKNK